MTLHERIQAVIDFFNVHGRDIVLSLSIGSGSSVAAVVIISPEIIHGAWTVFFGLLTTTLVFFLNRLLNKLFPKKK